ncbi:MAG: quinoprotein dehydrogenase-associated SoxYZ-like carrier [Hyphomicrobiaceae bacterium]
MPTSSNARPVRSAAVLLAAIALVAGASVPALAGGTWDGLKPEVFGTRSIAPGAGVVTLRAPFRPEDQRAVPVEIDAHFADGRTVKSVTLVVDENPSPVAAVFTMGSIKPKAQFSVKTRVRLNQETSVRVIVEASDGALYMAAQHVRFAGGQAACAAPPMGNPEDILASMGRMQLEDMPAADAPAATSLSHRVRLAISHPNHTGMALDQITLLYIPLRMVTSLEVRQGDAKLFDVAGSITLAQNPVFEFDVDLLGGHELAVELKDSDDTVWLQRLPIRAGS